MKQNHASFPGLEAYTVPLDGLGPTPGSSSSERPEQKGGALIEESINKFNADVQFALTSLASKIEASREGLVGKGHASTLHARAELLLDRYALVDALALHFQNKTRRTLLTLLWLALLAMILLEAFAHGVFQLEPLLREEGSQFQWLPRLFGLYLLVWVAVHVVWLSAHRLEYQNKYHDYRVLAEGLRVQFF